MESTTQPWPAPILGSALEATAAAIPVARTIVVLDKCSPGTWKGETVDYGLGAAGPKQLLDTVWSMKYAALYFFDRSPWVEHHYVLPIADVKLLGPNDPIPDDAWVHEFADSSDQPGAIGYHEGQMITKLGASGPHAERGRVLHPTGLHETVLMRSFVKTAREDGVYVTEVATHELFEAAVDPYVNKDADLRVYTNPADGLEYICEVGDPVQERAFDVGAPEGRPCRVPEAVVSDFAYPAWWDQPQDRAATCFTDDATAWATLPSLAKVPPFTVAAGGYMSRRSPGGEWEQEYGSKHADHKPNPQ